MTIQDFVESFRVGVKAFGDRYADTREGSVYDIIAGMSAIVWSREMQHDADRFRDVVTSGATDDALTARIREIYQVERILDAPGEGTISISRPVDTGSGTIWEGTTIYLASRTASTLPSTYEVTADTTVSGTVASIPIRSATIGNRPVTALLNGDVYPRWADAVYDANWRIDYLECGAGTTFEPAAQYIARARKTRHDARAGFKQALITACSNAGAARVVAFPSDYAGVDYGLNIVYVADASGSSTPALISACRSALESARILGDCTQVLPMSTVALSITAQVTLTDSPSKFDLAALTQRIRNVLVAATNDAYSYTLSGWEGSILHECYPVQAVTFSSPSVDSSLITTIGGIPQLPATLTRYIVRPENINLAYG